MICSECTNEAQWEEWLTAQQFTPFLQSYTMGEVYKSLGQSVFRLQVVDGEHILAQCQVVLVPARRGRHLVIQYGPVFASGLDAEMLQSTWHTLLASLTELAKSERALCVRYSPFIPSGSTEERVLKTTPQKQSPLHLLAEHVWYVPLITNDPWQKFTGAVAQQRTEEELFAGCRSTVRNLVRRAEKEGIVIERSSTPEAHTEDFIRLHDETRKRHHFTPYSNAFFRAQVAHFAPKNQCSVYVARYQNQIISASVHMHYGKETSYHHGASSSAHSKLPSSYALQWQAIKDALTRKDHIYNFWGIAPVVQDEEGKWTVASKRPHPFTGVTTFKTGFGGTVCNLVPAHDIVTNPMYFALRAFETVRKWKRGF